MKQAMWLGAALCCAALVGCAGGARSTTASPSKSALGGGQTDFVIAARAVGPIVAGQPIPASVFRAEGKSYDALVTQGGQQDQDGFTRVTFSKLGLVVQLRADRTVRTLLPSARLRTAEGVGEGSTLGRLSAAHGPLQKNNIPPPWLCSVGSSALPGVFFQFRAPCAALTDTSKVGRVMVHDPDSED